MWAGARANYGVSSPCSIAFQLKVCVEDLKVRFPDILICAGLLIIRMCSAFSSFVAIPETSINFRCEKCQCFWFPR